MKPQRLHYIDIAKGFAILLVIIGHCRSAPQPLRLWLYNFHMPLFFALSGITFSVRRYPTFKAFAMKKIKTLVVPYFALSLLLWLACIPVVYLIKGNITTEYFEGLLGILLGHRLHKYYFSMWFLPALFFAELPLYFFVKWFQNKKQRLQNIITVSAIMILLVLGKVLITFVQGFYMSLDLVPFAMAFILMGYLIKINQSYVQKLYKMYLVPIYFILTALLTFPVKRWTEGLDLYYCQMGNAAFALFAAVIGILFSLSLCYNLKQNKYMEYIGRNSILYYAFNFDFTICLLYAVVEKLFAYAHLTALPLLSTVYFVIVLAGTVPLLTVLSYLINRFLPFAAGKTKQPSRNKAKKKNVLDKCCLHEYNT